jgi:hypothetical protein
MAGECGECTACCRVFAIPEFDKPAGKWCEHCAIGVGCKIYEQRPERCVDYSCLWLLSQQREQPKERLAPELRPDRCRVVIGPTTNPKIMAVTPMPGYPLAWRTGPVRVVIDRLVASGMAVAVQAPLARTSTLVDRYGEREVEMTEPDADGMQWSKRQ